MSWPAYWLSWAFISGVVSAAAAGMVICCALSWSCTLLVANEEAHTSRPPAKRRTTATTMPVQEMSLSNELRMMVLFLPWALWVEGPHVGFACRTNVLLQVVVAESTTCLVPHTEVRARRDDVRVARAGMGKGLGQRVRLLRHLCARGELSAAAA